MIVHTGEALIDFIPGSAAPRQSAPGSSNDVPPPTFSAIPGGSPYNCAIATARLEVPNAFLGTMATDFFGDQLIEHLQQNGVNTDLIVRIDAPTTLAFVQKSDTGDARYAFYAENAADRALTPDRVPVLADEVQALQFGSISLIPEPVGSTVLDLVAGERGRIVTSFDPNIRESLITDETAYRGRIESAFTASTIVKISDEDLAWVYPGLDVATAAQRIIATGAALVVVTAGADGATAYTDRTDAHVPAVPVSVVDTVGAGDSYHGGILAWLYHAGKLRNEAIADLGANDLKRMLTFAGTVAATTCSRAGNDPPRLATVRDQLR